MGLTPAEIGTNAMIVSALPTTAEVLHALVGINKPLLQVSQAGPPIHFVWSSRMGLGRRLFYGGMLGIAASLLLPAAQSYLKTQAWEDLRGSCILNSLATSLGLLTTWLGALFIQTRTSRTFVRWAPAVLPLPALLVGAGTVFILSLVLDRNEKIGQFLALD